MGRHEFRVDSWADIFAFHRTYPEAFLFARSVAEAIRLSNSFDSSGNRVLPKKRPFKNMAVPPVDSRQTLSASSKESLTNNFINNRCDVFVVDVTAIIGCFAVIKLHR